MSDCFVKRCRATEENSEFVKYLGKQVCVKHWNAHCQGAISLADLVNEGTEDKNMEKKVKVKVEKSAKVLKEKTVRKSMTVGQTKLGATLVIRKAECVKLGFSESTPTSEVISFVKSKLGL